MSRGARTSCSSDAASAHLRNRQLRHTVPVQALLVWPATPMHLQHFTKRCAHATSTRIGTGTGGRGAQRGLLGTKTAQQPLQSVLRTAVQVGPGACSVRAEPSRGPLEQPREKGGRRLQQPLKGELRRQEAAAVVVSWRRARRERIEEQRGDALLQGVRLVVRVRVRVRVRG